MKISLRVDSKRLEEALKKAGAEVLKELRIALKTSTRTIISQARRVHRFKNKSGQLSRSMRSTVHQTALYAEVFLDEGIASYGKFVHDGTKPHEIRAKNKQALHFVMGGKSWFVPKRPYIGNKIKNPYWAKLKEQGANISFKGHVNHPGTKPDQFLYNAATAKTDEVLKTINTAIDTAYRKAGV